MGFTEVLTGILILLKLCDRIHISWFLVLLPEIIAVVVDIIMVVCAAVAGKRMQREIDKLFDELREDMNNGE